MNEGLVAHQLAELTAAIDARYPGVTSHGLLGGEYGYGATFENEMFAMHPYCWCERDDCPWCAGCTCPDDAYRYLVDGVEVSGDAYVASGPEAVCSEEGVVGKMCAICTGDAHPAPNFVYKPTGMSVWWYKYLGRGMEIDGDAPADWFSQCVASLGELVDAVVIEASAVLASPHVGPGDGAPGGALELGAFSSDGGQ